MSKNGRGIIIYVVIILAILGFVYWITSSQGPSETYTYREFETDMNAGAITHITIKQNSEIPTGIVVVKFNDNTTYCFKFYFQ